MTNIDFDRRSTGVVSSSEAALSIRNDGSGEALICKSSSATAVVARSKTQDAVAAKSEEGVGVFSTSSHSTGVVGTSGGANGVHGTFDRSKRSTSGPHTGPIGNGVYGTSTATNGSGVRGENSSGGAGVWGSSKRGDGVFGAGNTGVRGQSSKTTGSGVVGENTRGGTGVSGSSDRGDGVVGRTSASDASGVRGANDRDGTGVDGFSEGGAGVSGRSAGDVGVRGESSGDSESSHGIVGISHHTDANGVRGINEAPGAVGVSGHGGATGVSGFGQDAGVVGRGQIGVDGEGAIGVVGRGRNGLQGRGAIGVVGVGVGTIGKQAPTSGVGVAAFGGLNGEAVYADGLAARFAGVFLGSVTVSGAVLKSGGGFQIDHPLDPANKYLHHAFVESAEMKNIYDGVVVLDEAGEAVVELPSWFHALNIDFRYQLTAIGLPAPNLHVAQELSQGRFRLAGGTARGKVSWQVTGIRNDLWARANRLPIEQHKVGLAKGCYRHPELYQQSEAKRIGRRESAEVTGVANEPQRQENTRGKSRKAAVRRASKPGY